jgi:hypothetical protein
MTWDAFHHRGDVLRSVVDEANARRDGVLPMDLPGVAETFGDETALVAALQLRWHTRLAGRIERSLMDRPDDLESAVVSAWRGAATELVGVREILDAHRAAPATPEMGAALEKAHAKEAVLLAAMAGRASASDAAAVRLGERIEQKARAAYDPTATPRHRPPRRRRARGSLRALPPRSVVAGVLPVPRPDDGADGAHGT